MSLPQISCLLVGLLLSIQTAFSGSLKEGLVAHWPLNRIDGEMVKDLGPRHLDALGQSLNVVEGRGGKVIAFDGQSSGLVLPDDSELEVKGDYSVSFWVRIPAETKKDGPIFAQPSFAIYNFKGGLRVTVRNPEFGNTGYADHMGPKIDDGEWHHVVFTFDGDTGQTGLYVDRTEVMSGNFAHKPEVSRPTTVGFFGRFRFEGEISDLRVYSRTLSEAEVVELNEIPLPL